MSAGITGPAPGGGVFGCMSGKLDRRDRGCVGKTCKNVDMETNYLARTKLELEQKHYWNGCHVLASPVIIRQPLMVKGDKLDFPALRKNTVCPTAALHGVNWILNLFQFLVEFHFVEKYFYSYITCTMTRTQF